MRLGGAFWQSIQMGLPQTLSVLMVTGCVVYIYAIVGMVIFGRMDTTQMAYMVGDKAGFDTFMTSMLTLSRCASGESYNGIMHGAFSTLNPPNHTRKRKRLKTTNKLKWI